MNSNYELIFRFNNSLSLLPVNQRSTYHNNFINLEKIPHILLQITIMDINSSMIDQTIHVNPIPSCVILTESSEKIGKKGSVISDHLSNENQPSSQTQVLETKNFYSRED